MRQISGPYPGIWLKSTDKSRIGDITKGLHNDCTRRTPLRGTHPRCPANGPGLDADVSHRARHGVRRGWRRRGRLRHADTIAAGGNPVLDCDHARQCNRRVRRHSPAQSHRHLQRCHDQGPDHHGCLDLQRHHRRDRRRSHRARNGRRGRPHDHHRHLWDRDGNGHRHGRRRTADCDRRHPGRPGYHQGRDPTIHRHRDL